MPKLRIALAQYDFPVGAIAANAARMRSLMADARGKDVDLVLFPELSLSGYPPEDLLLRPSFLEACAAELPELAAAAEGIQAVVGHPHCVGQAVYNAASWLADGIQQRTYAKRALPNYAVFDEKRYFQPGREACVLPVDGALLGLLVCEDIWEAEPAAAAAAAGAELLLVINASPYAAEKAAERRELLCTRARECKLPIAYLNLVGGQDDLVFDGASLLVDSEGKVVALAPAFEDALLVFEFDSKQRSLSPQQWPAPSIADTAALNYRAIVRATRDYVDKNRFPGVLLGLSGGVDSALTLAIAVDALGAERVTAVMMPSRYTSKLSLDQAEAQARDLAVAFHVLPIEAPFQAFAAVLAPLFAGRPADLTEENIQARCRGVLLMALSNKLGCMLLTTGNKSEMAVGYATLYGDMCGGYAPLKDLYKTEAYALCRYRNSLGAAIPQAVIERAPSAELRDNQTDQDSLPPYEMLDGILQMFIEQDLSAAEIIAAGFPSDQVQRVIRLVLLNEHKRRQSAPGPRISSRSFGRDRRYPITSGWR